MQEQAKEFRVRQWPRGNTVRSKWDRLSIIAGYTGKQAWRETCLLASRARSCHACGKRGGECGNPNETSDPIDGESASTHEARGCHPGSNSGR
ncbi:hypothetical protein HVPorG_04840 [Roseomonas mucosa]|nr:hypothetical protein HVPorG_04840 [Roseomonas mucosa]